MQDYNKRNLIFLGVVALAALAAFFAVVMLTYAVESGGLWSAPLPIAAIAYGIYCFVKKYLPRNE